MQSLHKNTFYKSFGLKNYDDCKCIDIAAEYNLSGASITQINKKIIKKGVFMRLTEKTKSEKLEKKDNLTIEEQMYVKLARFETEQEEKNLFTKSQLNIAVSKSIQLLSDAIKVKITKEVLAVLITELKQKEKDGKISYLEVKELAKEIVKKVAETK